MNASIRSQPASWSALRFALLLAVTTGGCIADPTLVDDDPIPLSQADAKLLGLEVWRAFFEAGLAAETDPSAVAPSGPAAAPVAFAEAVDTTVACEFGGTIATHMEISGSGDDETGEVELTLRIVQTHQACVEGEGETRFTLYGRPDVAATFSFALDSADGITLSGSIEGAILAAAGGRSGLCSVAISFSGQQDASGVGQYQVAGTACGAAVDESVSVG